MTKILALDVATKTGFCVGIAGEKPSYVKSVHLRPGPDDVIEDAAFNIERFVHTLHKLENFDLVVCEAALPLAAQKSMEAALLAWLCYSAVYTFCRKKRIMFRTARSDNLGKHFLGKSRWSKEEGGRKAKKAATVQRCHVLGYLPRTCRDDDMADACMIFDYASYVILKRRPPPEAFHLFGEEPAEPERLTP